MPIIIGIDPGSRITGYGVIHSEGSQHQYIDSGCIHLKESSLDQKLVHIFEEISNIVKIHKPSKGAIEQVFMHQNAGGALKLGQARGSAIVAMAKHQIPVAEYSARQVKQAVVGYGAAKKEQVQHMVRTILNLTDTPPSDAADALAIAICHAQMPEGVMGSLRRSRRPRSSLRRR